MDLSKSLQYEFDESKRILQFSYSELVHIQTKEELAEMAEYSESIMRRYAQSNRIYFIINFQLLVIEPNLFQLYAAFVKKVSEKYFMPSGIARYGTQLTRITIKLSHEKILKTDSCMCKTKNEAYEYIEQLIEQHKTVQAEI